MTEIAAEMIEAGVATLVCHFGGETEDDNRIVDFEESAKKIFLSKLSARQ